MARKKYQVELPNGNFVWFTGETISEAINNGLKKYAFAYFDGAMDFTTACERLKKNTRVYAKKQLTWYAKDPDIITLHPTTAVHEILSLL